MCPAIDSCDATNRAPTPRSSLGRVVSVLRQITPKLSHSRLPRKERCTYSVSLLQRNMVPALVIEEQVVCVHTLKTVTARACPRTYRRAASSSICLASPLSLFSPALPSLSDTSTVKDVPKRPRILAARSFELRRKYARAFSLISLIMHPLDGAAAGRVLVASRAWY